MKKIKLGGRIAWSYALLFLTLMAIFIIMLNVTLKNENKKVLETAAEKKIEEIEKTYLNKIAVYSELYDNLPLEFNPQFDGKKVTYRKPFDPGEESYLYLVEIKTVQENRVPLNTVSSQYDIVDESVGYDLKQEIEKNKITENTNMGKIITLSDDNKYFVFKLSREIKNNILNIYVLKNVNQVSEIYDRLNTLSIIFICIGVAIAIIMSIILGQKIVRPIKNIIRTTEKITTDDLNQRIEEPKQDDELKTLTQIINQMLDRLENSFENQTKFVSDASHELRTPLAIIKGYAEIIKKRRFSDEEIFEESIDSIINETENMKNLVQKLLFLAKGEITKINTNFQIIEMKEFVQQIHTDTEVSSKSHKFYLEKNQEYKVEADVTLLQQAIRALIENAIKYSEENTNIYIESIIKDGKKGIVSIRDEGVGISEEDTKRIFDRFYRVDDSRTKATGGTGLGLAIVKRIVEIHKGEIEILSELGKGTKISIILPLATIETEKKNQKIRNEKRNNMKS
jgi:histidine kinase